MYYVPEGEISKSIFAVDWHGTIIQQNNGARRVDMVNIEWTFDSVPEFLNKLNKDGWTVVIFSNQSNSPEITYRRQYQWMLDNGLDFEPLIFIGTGGKFTKPNTGMWETFETYLTKEIGAESLYCGDHGEGVSENPYYSTSSTDSDFAKEIGLAYYDPMEIFPNVDWNDLEFENPALVIMVGQQGSGKTYFSRWLEENKDFEYTNRENRKYKKTITEWLSNKKNVVFDATNPTMANRQELIQISEEMSSHPYIVWSSRPGRRLNSLREKKIPEIALNTYTSKFQAPDLDEGATIYRIN